MVQTPGALFVNYIHIYVFSARREMKSRWRLRRARPLLLPIHYRNYYRYIFERIAESAHRDGNQTGGAYVYCIYYTLRHRATVLYIATYRRSSASTAVPPPPPPGLPPFYAALKVSCRANIVGCVAIGIIALKSKMVSRYTLFVIKILRIHSKIISRFIQTAAAARAHLQH